MLILPLLIVITVWYLIICLRWKKKVFDIMEKMPGLKWYPFFGTFYKCSTASATDVLSKYMDMNYKYAPRLYRSWNGSVHEVNLMKAEHLQIIMKSSTHSAKGPFNKHLFEWLGESVFLSEGAKWFFQRKLLTPSFHFKILEIFTNTLTRKAIEFKEDLSLKADGEYFDVLDAIHPIALSSLCETSLGVPLKEIQIDLKEYIKNSHEITEMAMWRYWMPWVNDTLFYLLPQGRRFRRALKGLRIFSDRVVAYRKEHRENRTENLKNYQSFMDLLLEANEKDKSVNDEDLHRMVDAFTFAGFETTGNSLGSAVFLLGNHPEIQEKAYDEVKRVLKDKDAATTMEELNQLQYIDCIIKEALRLYAPLPLITRKTTEDLEIDGYKIPSGTQAVLQIAVVQKDPEQYPEPNKFDPDRFLPENSKNRHPFAFIPFSAGPRNCLGMRFALLEMRMLLATMVKNFKITSLETPEEFEYVVNVITRPTNGIRIKLEKREDQ